VSHQLEAEIDRSSVAEHSPGANTQAAKNRLAHTEPAAGAVGLAAAAARLGRADASSRFLHLRALNPYVASVADGFLRQRGFAARRQPGAQLGSPDLRFGSGSSHLPLPSAVLHTAHLLVASLDIKLSIITFAFDMEVRPCHACSTPSRRQARTLALAAEQGS
jgi:hypothetical protein